MRIKNQQILETKGYLWAAVFVTVVGLVLFKFIYPYPNMVLDSYYYIMYAMAHAKVGPWAIGYSWFLEIVGAISHSPLVLVVLQYLILVFSFVAFFLTTTKIFRVSGYAKWVLFVFLFVNPLFFFCANFIMSDALFISLSSVWLCVLLEMILKPKVYLLLLHTVLIAVVFTVRYNALYYPILAIGVIVISGYTLVQKIAGIAVMVILLGSFVWYTCSQVEQATGTRQFSPVGSWKLANDALYMYGHVSKVRMDAVPAKFGKLDSAVRAYFSPTRKIDNLLNYSSPFYGSFYQFAHGSPLMRYRVAVCGDDTLFVNFQKMARMGPLYGEYGSYLIRKYPVGFMKYFIAPNAIRYLYPPMECFTSMPPFYLRDDFLGRYPQEWFGLKTLTVGQSYIELRNNIMYLTQVILTCIHVLFFIGLIMFLSLRLYRQSNRLEKNCLRLVLILWLCDLGFNLTATVSIVRYQMFLYIVELSLLLCFFQRIYSYFTINRPS